jgi:hypothetical protein
MPIGRIFGDLSVFDLLGNFVPGLILLSTLFLVLPSDRAMQALSSPLAAVFLLGVVAFALGHLIQSYAAKAVGSRETFRNSIFLHQSLGRSPILDFNEHPTVHPYLYSVYECLHPDEPEEWNHNGPQNGIPQSGDGDDGAQITDQIPRSEISLRRLILVPARVYRAVVEAVMMVRIKRDRPLSDVTLAGKAWTLCRKKYDLDSDYDEYGDLLHLMSSDIESHSTTSRALRFQALRNFHRGMWIACYFSLLLLGMVVLAQGFSGPLTVVFSFLGMTTWQPVIVELWTPVWMLCVGYATLLYLFWELKEEFEEEFVEYLLTDFVTANTELRHEETHEPQSVSELLRGVLTKRR